MAPIISVQNLTKTYANGFEALKGINLDVEKGRSEIYTDAFLDRQAQLLRQAAEKCPSHSVYRHRCS